MDTIADLIVSVLKDQQTTDEIKKKVIDLRTSYQKIHYCFD
ncbi:hypothetical protein [Sporolactobacillus pectinivorans]|nr:hypothetical protein [Sporolactobacillus pectinivorans]